jgi:hypothetical protein
MPDKIFPTAELLTILTHTPQRIAGLTAGLPPAHLHTPPGRGEWSANDVLAHLRSCADLWNKAIAVILAEDMPTLVAISPRAWLKKTDYLQQDFGPSLRAFTSQRRELLDLLEPLPPAGWARRANITGAVRPFVRTVHNFAQRMALHEREHVRQIERIVAAVAA